MLTLALPLYACLLCWRYGRQDGGGRWAGLAGNARTATALCPGGDLAILGVLVPWRDREHWWGEKRRAETDDDGVSGRRSLPRCCAPYRPEPTPAADPAPRANRCRRCPQSRPAADGTKPDDREGDRRAIGDARNAAAPACRPQPEPDAAGVRLLWLAGGGPCTGRTASPVRPGR